MRTRRGNKRIWKQDSSSVVTWNFYGARGERIMGDDVYFGGKPIRAGGGVVLTDRVGSVIYQGAPPIRSYSASGTARSYFPYGEERNIPSSADNLDKFATYFRDSGTGLDYADQRYFSSGTGRFLSSDPYQASGGASDPGSWNRSAYVQNDPTNYADQTGLNRAALDVYSSFISGMCFEETWSCPQPSSNGEGGSGISCPAIGMSWAALSGCEFPNSSVYEPEEAFETEHPIPIYCQPDVIKAMSVAWTESGNGASPNKVEAGFRIDGPALDRQYRIVKTPFTNEPMKQKMSIIRGLTTNIFHVHPNGGIPEPSANDRSIADKYLLNIFSFSKSGLYEYDPVTKNTQKVRDGLDWLKPCK